MLCEVPNYVKLNWLFSEFLISFAFFLWYLTGIAKHNSVP
jgi:hypothetical protein